MVVGEGRRVKLVGCSRRAEPREQSARVINTDNRILIGMAQTSELGGWERGDGIKSERDREGRERKKDAGWMA